MQRRTIFKKQQLRCVMYYKKGRMFNLSVSLFIRIVVPISLYGCEIWGFTNLQMIERLHLKFCKILLNLKKSTSTYMVYSVLGAKPLSNIYWCKAVESNCSYYQPKMADAENGKIDFLLYLINCFIYLMIYKYVNNGIDIKWLSCVRNILDECGLSYIWNDHTLHNFNVQWLKLTIKQILSDQLQQFMEL